MANLSRPRLDADRRGQVLLVTGFALAVVFVGLALVFNSVIYTENLATRSESTTTSDPIVHADSLEKGTAELLVYVNEHNATNTSNYARLEENMTRAFDNMSGLMTRHQLEDGQVVDDELLDIDRGTWIRQSNESRNFTNAHNESDWSPVNASASGVRNARFNITDVGILEPLGGGTEFTMTAEDGSGATWTMQVGSGTDAVKVTTPSGTVQCGPSTAGVTDFWINVSDGTVADGTGGVESCPELAFQGLDTVEEISFTNGDAAEGTYQFVVNKTWDGPSVGAGVDTVDDENVDYGPNARFPVTDPAIWNVLVQTDYETDVLQYVTEFRVSPGDADA